MPLAGMAMRGSAPEQNGASRLFARPWLADPDLLDHVPIRFVALLTSRQPAAGRCVSAQQTATAGSW